MAVFGMLAFSSATQRWIRVKTNGLEVVLLIAITLLLMIPNVIQSWLNLPYEYVSYAIGLSLYAVIYGLQMRRHKAQLATLKTA